MTAVFVSFAVDFLFAIILGVFGGIAAELITNKGDIEKWHSTDKSFIFDMGNGSNIILGVVAALEYLFVLETSDPYKFVGAMIGAGVGGSSILTAIKQKLVSSITTEQLENQQVVVENAANNIEEVQQELENLQTQMGNITEGKRSNIDTETTFSKPKEKITFTQASLKNTLTTQKTPKEREKTK